MRTFYSLEMDPGETIAVLRADRGIVERWYPGKGWVATPQHVDEIYGTEKRFAREITEAEAEALTG